MPGNTIELTTSLTSLEHVSVPGNYRTIVSYSIGGDSAAHSGSATFIYVTWWHLLVMAGAVAVGWGLYRYGRHIHHRKKIAKKLPHKRPLLIGRDIT
jgi:hypothetical protein